MSVPTPPEELEYSRVWTNPDDFPSLSYSKNWTVQEDFPTVETDEVRVRADMQALYTEIKDYINGTNESGLPEEQSWEGRGLRQYTVDMNGSEAGREAAEAQRVLNEQGRVDAEAARVDETTGVVAQATAQANAAAASADEAAAYARQAAAHTDLPMARGISGTDSLVIGDIVNNTATGEYSVAKGHGTEASGKWSTAEGYLSKATGPLAAHAEGNNTTASGQTSHAEGENTTASGRASHAEGNGTTASGYGAHAEGDRTSAVSGAHAEGMQTRAHGSSSHAEGEHTYASVGPAHVEGYLSEVSAIAAHAEGYWTKAAGRSQHVVGEYNIVDQDRGGGEPGEGRGDYVEIVGNGTSNNARSNARTLDWDGNEWLAGGLTLGGKLNAASNENLLDNAYFIGGGTAGKFPVNQRYPQTQWTGAAHTIDRWRTWVPEQVTSVTASGFEVAVPANASDLGSVCQYFDTFPVPVGQPVTFSVLTADGDLVTETGNYNGTSFEMRKSASWGQIYAYDVGSGAYQKGVIIIVNKGVTKTFAAAKLELGSRQTLARKVGDNWVLNDPPPDYGEELAKCQRYLQVFEGWEYTPIGHVYPTSATQLSIAIPLTVPMKGALASIGAGTTVYVSTNGGWNQTVTIPASSQNVRLSPNFAQVDVTLASALSGTFPSMALLSCTPTTKLIISAE